MDSDSKNSTTDETTNSSPGTLNTEKQTEADTSRCFILPSVSGSSPKSLTVNEIVNVMNNIQKMEIVHEIALNPDFKLQPYEAAQNGIEKRIKDIMHKAFWDVLREQLSRNPPCYEHAMQLLNDIKECLSEILPANKRTLEHVNEVLDASLIKQQAEQGVLNFRSYADFIIQIMAKSCAPVRDEQIRKLSQIEDVVETFKGILETLTVMKLDVANWLIEFSKRDLMANSIQYEKEKFKEYLEYYKYGFPATENWLKRNEATNKSTNTTVDEIIYNAYIELLDWNDSYEFPEILNIDKNRLSKLSAEILCLCMSASVMAICSGIPVLLQNPENRTTFAHQIYILLQNKSQMEMKDALENVWLNIQSTVKTHLQEDNQNLLFDKVENTIKAQILNLEDKESVVRKLMWDRLNTYLNLVLRTKSGLPQLPSGFSDFKDELENVSIAFRRIIIHNYLVFGDFYVKILTEKNYSCTTSKD